MERTSQSHTIKIVRIHETLKHLNRSNLPMQPILRTYCKRVPMKICVRQVTLFHQTYISQHSELEGQILHIFHLELQPPLKHHRWIDLMTLVKV